MHLAWEAESFPTRFFEIPWAVNTAFHHVLPAVSWGSRRVRTLLPEHEQLSCLQSNYGRRLCLQKLSQPAGLIEHLTNFSRGCVIFQKQQSCQLACGRHQKPKGRVSVIAWRYPLITFNFLSSSEGSLQSGGSRNEAISSGEAELLKLIMKLLQMFPLMLFGCIDLGTGPGRPHTSFPR